MPEISSISGVFSEKLSSFSDETFKKEKATECQGNVLSLDKTMTFNNVLSPFVIVDSIYLNQALREITKRWSVIDSFRISRMPCHIC